MSACIAVVPAFFGTMVVSKSEYDPWMCDICLGQD